MKYNETSFIKQIVNNLPPYKADVVVGVGDDAAVLKQKGRDYLLVTCDGQVEGIHFKRSLITPQALGRRAVAVAISDIAAMGGVPQHMLISLIVPAKMTSSYLTKLYAGIRKKCQTYGMDVIGGNLSRGDTFVIDAFVLGKVYAKNIVGRNGARPGDKVLVTGTLGKAAAALRAERFLIPNTRLKEGRLIGDSRLATSMIDVSDGLSTDLLHICDASGVGVRIFLDKLPISNVILASDKGARPESDGDPGQARMTVLNGGEDYELCFTAKPKNAAKLADLIETKTKTRVSIIGKILRKNEGRRVVDGRGRERPLKPLGWNHFR